MEKIDRRPCNARGRKVAVMVAARLLQSCFLLATCYDAVCLADGAEMTFGSSS